MKRRESMFTKRWKKPPCMNILVIKVQRYFPSKIFDGLIATKSKGTTPAAISIEKSMNDMILIKIKIDVTLRELKILVFLPEIL